MKKRVFLDYAATTPMREEVLEAMTPLLCAAGANPSASYASAREAKRALESAREQIADVIGVSAKEVYFTSGGTEGDNWALRALVRPGKNHIVTCASEHHAVLDTCAALERDGAIITVTPADRYARASVDAVSGALRDDTALVSCMYANNETGAVNRIRDLADAAHEHGVPLHCDAVSAAGHIRIDAAREGIDLMTLSAHKFYGPPGTGALYIKEGLPVRRFLYGGRQERGLRAGTQYVAGAVGMACALRLAAEEMDAETRRLCTVRNAFRAAILSAVPDTKFISPEQDVLPGILSILIPGTEAGAVLIHLDRSGFEAAAGSACMTGAGKPSHVLRAAGLDAAQARSVLRVSLGRGTDVSDAKPFADCLRDAASHRQK